MIDYIMPDIPRIYTAIAEWVACMLFILPVKKRFDRLKTGLLAAGALIIQSLFLMVTGFFGGNRKCADLFLDSVYGYCSIADDWFYLWML